MVQAAIGIGSSLGDRLAVVRDAIALLDTLDKTKVISVSDFYNTMPVGGVAVNDFVNACALVETELSPYELLLQMLHIETRLGRTRRLRKWEDRICGLDLLDYDSMVLDDPDCTLPHPLMAERAFVLVPLRQIAPDLRHPVRGQTVTELCEALPKEACAAVHRIDTEADSPS